MKYSTVCVTSGPVAHYLWMSNGLANEMRRNTCNVFPHWLRRCSPIDRKRTLRAADIRSNFKEINSRNMICQCFINLLNFSSGNNSGMLIIMKLQTSLLWYNFRSLDTSEFCPHMMNCAQKWDLWHGWLIRFHRILAYANWSSCSTDWTWTL